MYPIPRLPVYVVEIRRDIRILEVGHRALVLPVGRAGLVQLVVARTYDVDLLLSVDVIRVIPLGIRRVEQPISFDPIACIHEKHVNSVVVGSLSHVVGKADVVAPIRRVLRSRSSFWSASEGSRD